MTEPTTTGGIVTDQTELPPRRIIGHGPDALALLRALGVDPHCVRRVALIVEVGQPVRFEIDKMLDLNRVDITALDSLHRTYRMTPAIERTVVELEPVEDDPAA